MEKRNTIVAGLVAMFLCFSFTSFAQLQMPMPSPAGSVTQQVGFTNISISYSSPGVKGRTIFGDLVPWGTPWRAGANAATTITFSTGVKIGGKNLRAGTYSIFITPQESGEWTVHLNSKGNMIYAYIKDGKVDMDALKADEAASVDVAVQTVPKAERLHYHISAGDNKTAMVHMHWDTYKVSFEVDTNAAQMLEGFQKTLN